MQREVTEAEGRALVGSASAELGAYHVGFVRLVGGVEESDAEVAGSGTLVVTSGGRHAILTAAHVVEELPTRGKIGLALAADVRPRLERFTVPVEQVDMVRIAGASRTPEGPDLGLVFIPEAVVRGIEARNKAFYRLASRRDRMLERPPENDLGFWVMCGVIGEWTLELAPERNFSRVKGIKAFCGAGVVSSFLTRGRFDYMTFETRFGAGYGGPQNYGGVSGGGIWQILLKERQGSLEVAECLLSGVVFYQTPVAGGIDLSCHGRRSVYEHAIEGRPV